MEAHYDHPAHPASRTLHECRSHIISILTTACNVTKRTSISRSSGAGTVALHKRTIVKTLFRTRFGATLLIALTVVGCADDATRPEVSPTLTPTVASPFSLVLIDDLPDAFRSTATTIRVGDTPTAMILDPGSSRYGFIVPQVDAGPATVTLAHEGTGVEIPFQVTGPGYVGGSPQAATERMSAQMDSALTSLSYISMRLTPQDTAANQLIAALQEILAETQGQLNNLDEDGRAALAAFFAAHPDAYDLMLTQTVSALQSLEPIRTAFGPAPEPTPQASMTRSFNVIPGLGTADRFDTAGSFIAHCTSRLHEHTVLDGLDIAIAVADMASSVLLMVPGGAAAYPVLQGVFATGSIVIQLRLAYIRYDAFLPVQQGAHLVVQPYQVTPGSSVSVRAFVQRTSPLQAVGSAANTVAQSILRENADLTTKAARLRARNHGLFAGAVTLGIAAIEQLLDRGDLQLTRRSGLTQLYFSGLPVSYEPSFALGAWADPGKVLWSTLEVPEGSANGVIGMYFHVPSRAAECSIEVGKSDWRIGRNAFQVAQESAGLQVESGPDTLTLRQNSSASAPLTVRNHSRNPLHGFRIRAGTLTDTVFTPFVAPSGVGVRAYTYNSSVGAGGLAQVFLSVSATSAAAVGSFSVPITVEAEGAAPVLHAVQVTVNSQVDGIVVNSKESYVGLWDHGWEDGDSVRIELNGRVVDEAFFIRNSLTELPVEYNVGRNVLRITALNEGLSSPNTAGLMFRDIVEGRSSQTYNLRTGEVVSIVITYDPAMVTQPTLAPARPTYSADIEGDPGNHLSR